MNFNPELNRWIKTRYREAPGSGPLASRINFSDVLAEVQHAFLTMNVSTVVVSDEKELSRLVQARSTTALCTQGSLSAYAWYPAQGFFQGGGGEGQFAPP